MLKEISKHPSDISTAAVEYLEEVQVSEKTRRLYTAVLSLFIDSLCSDPSAVEETKKGEYLLTNKWDAYYGGAIEGFLDWWLPRKWMGSDTIPARAPAVLRKWIKWSYDKGYFEKERYDDFLLALPRNKAKNVQRLQKAGELLYRLHTPDPCAWMRGDYEKVVSIERNREPEEWEEGYMRIKRLGKDFAYLENEEGEEIGPVMLSQELVKVLRVGDAMNVGIGRFGKYWKVLESGNVYAQGIIS